jgi:hypothetical protein
MSRQLLIMVQVDQIYEDEAQEEDTAQDDDDSCDDNVPNLL